MGALPADSVAATVVPSRSLAANFGNRDADDAVAFELEPGPNNCAVSG